MIVWINGTFGVGKTTTANAIADRVGWRIFDPEHVGFLLADNMREVDFADFQELPPWRTLVPAVADEIYRFTQPAAMTAVQTVLVARYWDELMKGFDTRDLPVFHVLLECEETELRRRIAADEIERQALEWRVDHITEFVAARSWLTGAADLVVDTTNIRPDEAANIIVEAVAASSIRPEGRSPV